MPKTILFVCSANMCRSPMAEGMLRKMVSEKGKADEIRVESAGLIKTDGSPATSEAIKTMCRRGIDLKQHVARHINKKVASSASIILVMTRSHKEKLIALYPEFIDKIFMLSEFAEGKIVDIPDPVGMDIEAYGIVAALMERFLTEIVDKV